jgi:hypothetical protein
VVRSTEIEDKVNFALEITNRPSVLKKKKLDQGEEHPLILFLRRLWLEPGLVTGSGGFHRRSDFDGLISIT